MKSFSIYYKILAMTLVALLAFVPLSQINEYTYTTGIDNIHNHYGGCLPTPDVIHFNFNCTY